MYRASDWIQQHLTLEVDVAIIMLPLLFRNELQ
jgi:hypothetical protein